MHDKKYKQIVVLSGKGGTGKTMIASSLAEIAENKIIIDADVDAANMHLIFPHYINSGFDYFGGKKAQIDISKCSKCGLCEPICRFDAIKDFIVDLKSCEGCGFCFHVCPENAIDFYESRTGVYSECELEDRTKFYYAKLVAGEGNSGKLVSEIKKKAYNQAKDEIEWIIIDGPPGIGCQVNASISGADLALIVTEPTQSGLHDLKRILNLMKLSKVSGTVIINKYDINIDMSSNIEEYVNSEGIKILAKIPFDKNFIKAIQNSKTIIEYDISYSKYFKGIWEDIQSILLKQELQC
ncbi:MAG: ATP-binding protein [Ignavibacteriaceae bacterium]